MKRIFSYFKKMSVEDAITFFGLFGMALSSFAFWGAYLHFLVGWVATWLFFAGIFVLAVCSFIVFAKNGWFMHDITETK